MNIAIDLDGVIFDTERMHLKESEKYNKIYGGKLIDKQELRINKRYNWSHEQYQDYESKTTIPFQKICPVIDGAKRVIDRLAKNNRIFICSARGEYGQEEIDISYKRLAEEKIKVHEYLFNHQNKIDICKQNKIDIIIEDYYDNALMLAQAGIHVFYYREFVDKKIHLTNVTEVHNWQDIEREFEKLKVL